MPTYQYACTASACGHRFEAVQSFTDPALTSCPVCAGSVRKVFSPVGVVFKGSGFYRTDSRTGNGRDGNGRDGNGAAGKKNEAGTSGESTPAKSTSDSSGSSPSTPAKADTSGKANTSAKAATG